MGYDHLVEMLGRSPIVVDACVDSSVYRNLTRRGVSGVYVPKVVSPGTPDKTVAGMVPDGGVLLTEDVEFFKWFTGAGKKAILLTGRHHRQRLGHQRVLSRKRAVKIRKQIRAGFERMFGSL
jgi:uncharacterized protein YaiI (UPF0178 family)